MIGIISRRDLLRPFLRSDASIRQEITDEVIHRTMWMDPATLDVDVTDGLVTLRGLVERRSEREILAELVRRLDGVVGLNDELTYRTHDREIDAPPSRSELGWGENWARNR